jgi:hypothetical protein
MKTSPLILIILAFLLTSCDDESVELIDIEGTFIRTSPNSKYEPSKVTLMFSNGQFQGESEITKYPAICRGSYEIEETNVVFTDSCFWTAEFDWSLILSGEFAAELTSDELTLQRKNGSIWDLYELKRK